MACVPEIVAGLAGGKASSERADPAVETGTVRSATLRRQALSLLNGISIGFRSGEYGAEDMLLLLPELRATPDATNCPARLPGPIKSSTIINVFQAGHRNTSHETLCSELHRLAKGATDRWSGREEYDALRACPPQVWKQPTTRHI